MFNLSQTLASAAGLRGGRKKFHFDVSFSIQALLNCTYVTGVLFAKLRLKDGGSYVGASTRKEIANHCVRWEQELAFSCKLYASANTAELEPCMCKVSVRKETKGGKSYKKLGYAKINLAEFAGAGEVQRKYLLESYNEHKHKPDNSILKVKISLKQTSGDVLFKAPRAPIWELNEIEDEGIQADLHSVRSRVSSYNPRASTASSLSGFSGSNGNLKTSPSTTTNPIAPASSGGSTSSNGSSATIAPRSGSLLVVGAGGSWQDMRRRGSVTKGGGGGGGEVGRPKSVSAGCLREEEGSVTESISSAEEEDRISTSESNDEKLNSEGSSDKTDTPRNRSPKLSVLHLAATTTTNKTTHTSASRSNRSNSVGSDLDRPGRVMLLRSGNMEGVQQHRRQASLGVLTGTGSSSPSRHHRRQNSLVSGYSSKSTSAYSTLSEKSMGSLEAHYETASIASINIRSRLPLFPTSSRVEQSRVDAQSVVDKLFDSHDLTYTEEEGTGEGLTLYVDKNGGTLQLAGRDLERKYKNLRPVEMTEQNVSPRSARYKQSSSSSSSSKHSSNTTSSQSLAPVEQHDHPPPSSSSSSSSSSVRNSAAHRPR